MNFEEEAAKIDNLEDLAELWVMASQDNECNAVFAIRDRAYELGFEAGKNLTSSENVKTEQSQ